jgi:NAD(P)-dependent dehydrogenase (short-subunit alcohol dehydrogenase family)
MVASGTAPARTVDGLAGVAFDIASDAPQRLWAAVGTVDHLVIAVRPPMVHAPLSDVPEDAARRAFDVKFWGQYRLARAASDHLPEDGSIVLTSGIAGERIYPGSSTMALINGATDTLCRVLAVELAPRRVNVVSPGFVAPKPAETERYAGTFPLGRLATPDEVAGAYLHLITSPYTTGTVTVVDGGARLL